MSSVSGLYSHRRVRTPFAGAILCACASTATAQTADTTTQPLDEVVVSGSRMISTVETYPGSVSILDEAALAEMLQTTTDVSQILAQSIPGFATTQFEASNFTVTMRGREPAYLIDGFPQTVPLRGGGRDMRIIDPSALERIEVIRGATAIYGQGGAGGYINYITRRPTSEAWQFGSEVGIGTSLSGSTSDSVSYLARQSAMGRVGAVDAVFSGYYEQTGLFYDAEGDALPPDPFGQGGLADAKTYNAFLKLGTDFGDSHRVEAIVNYYKKEQDTDFVGSRQGVAVAGEIKSVATPKDSPDATFFGRGPIDPYTENLFAGLSYINTDFLASTLKVQGLYQDYVGSFAFNPLYYPDGGTSSISANKYSGRADVNTPLSAFSETLHGTLLWGVEWVRDETGEPLIEDASRTNMPFITLDTYSAFAQMHIEPTSRWSIQGGLRYDDASLDVPDFTVVTQYRSATDRRLRGGNFVRGGTRKYDSLVFNVGTAFHLSDWATVFAAFSQGFNVADVGRVLRTTTRASIDDIFTELDAQIIDSYELGVRGSANPINYSLALFYNTSKLGATFNPITLDLARAPEKIWGVEGTIDFTFDRVRFGGTVGWADSELDANSDGDYETKLDFWRVPPLKATAYVEYEFPSQWRARLQGIYSGSENRFPDVVPYTAFAQSPIDSFFTADLSVSGQVGPGTLSVGVQNLFNADYYPIISQTTAITRDEAYAKAPGAILLVKYGVNY